MFIHTRYVPNVEVYLFHIIISNYPTPKQVQYWNTMNTSNRLKIKKKNTSNREGIKRGSGNTRK